MSGCCSAFMPSCNMRCNSTQAKTVTAGVTTCYMESDNIDRMTERKYTKTFIREWRLKRGLSLRRLADRIELDESDGTVSHASIGRIENGLQPYSQPILEAIAAALSCSVTDLLTVDPTKDGDVVDLMRLINDKNRDQAIRVLRALTGS